MYLITNTSYKFIMAEKNVITVPEWMRSNLSIEEMYSKAIEMAEKKMAQNPIIAGSVKHTLAYWRSGWCTEALFNYLFIGGERALAELRAAAYPMPIGFTIRETGFWRKTGLFTKEWQAFYIPYIFTLKSYESKENRDDYSIIKRKHMPDSKPSYPDLNFYYMNCEHKVLSADNLGHVLDVCDESKFKRKEAYEKRVESMWAKLSKKNGWPFKYCRFLDIKTNKEQCAFIQTGIEDLVYENRRAGLIQIRDDGFVREEVLTADGTWLQTYDITSLRNNPNMTFEDYVNSIYTPEQQKKIITMGKISIIKLNEILFGTHNMTKSTVKMLTNYKNGKSIQLKHSEFFDQYYPKEKSDAYDALARR